MHFSWSVSCFCFQFLFCFVCCNKWLDHIVFVLERGMLRFSLPRTLCFSLLSFQRVFSFSATAFIFHFSPWFLFRSCYIFSSRCIWTSGPCWYLSKEFPQKSLNGVGKEKKLYAKKWYKKELM
jgi:hypothetical protein